MIGFFAPQLELFAFKMIELNTPTECQRGKCFQMLNNFLLRDMTQMNMGRATKTTC